jgi:toxin ParE1/3/4
MTKKIVITPKASQYLDDCFAYISQDNPETALRFFDLTRITIAQIARMPANCSFAIPVPTLLAK